MINNTLVKELTDAQTQNTVCIISPHAHSPHAHSPHAHTPHALTLYAYAHSHRPKLVTQPLASIRPDQISRIPLAVAGE